MSGDVIGRDRRYQSWKVFHETTKAIIENGDPLLFDLKRDLSRLYRVDLVGWPARKCIKQPCSIQGSSNFAREACMEIKNVLASVTGEQNTDTLDPKEAVRHYMNKPVKPIRKPEDLPNVPEIDGNFAVKFRSMAGKFSVCQTLLPENIVKYGTSSNHLIDLAKCMQYNNYFARLLKEPDLHTQNRIHGLPSTVTKDVYFDRE